MHHAVLKMKPDIVKFLIEYSSKSQDEDEDILQDWINTKTTKEKFTALHFAAFKGCLKSCQILVENGANMKVVNANGLSMMHLASQGDAANTLYYFHMMDLEINKQDLRGSTPAHWACFMQSEVALSYLVQWKPNLDLQDNEGSTPLHVAIKSSENVSSSKLVRYLLVNGAKTDI